MKRAACLLLLLCAAAPSGLVLSGTVPDHLADATTARALVQAGQGGLTGAEPLGRPYALYRGATVLGMLVPGRGADGSGKTCFLAWVAPHHQTVPVLAAAADCHGYTALGLLPSAAGQVRLGIVFDTGGNPASPVILAWRDGQPPAIDQHGTASCAARHAATIAEMRRPGCGAPTTLERAFTPRS